MWRKWFSCVIYSSLINKWSTNQITQTDNDIWLNLEKPLYSNTNTKLTKPNSSQYINDVLNLNLINLIQFGWANHAENSFWHYRFCIQVRRTFIQIGLCITVPFFFHLPHCRKPTTFNFIGLLLLRYIYDKVNALISFEIQNVEVNKLKLINMRLSRRVRLLMGVEILGDRAWVCKITLVNRMRV